MFNSFSPLFGSSMRDKQHDFVSSTNSNTSTYGDPLDFNKSAGSITMYNNSRRSKLNDRTYSNQELTLMEAPIITYDSNQQSNVAATDNGEYQKMKKVFVKGEIPKEIRKNNYGKIINYINQRFVMEWRKIEELENKDIDISLSFESDPESSDLEMIYNLFVMDLKEEEIEIVWKKLRKLLNRIIDNMKRSQPKYRKKAEKLEKLIAIHIEW